MAHASEGAYYIPHPSRWPIIGSVGLFALMLGAGSFLNGWPMGWLSIVGLLIIVYMLFSWFGEVIGESEKGTYNAQVDRSFRWGMSWFIFSEVMFFAAFFGTLFYARQLSVPWLAGAGDGFWSNLLLWPGYEGQWPTNGPGDVGGEFESMGPWGIPALNTALLLSSGATITVAHWALKEGKREVLNWFMFFTILLGATFLGFQAYEYHHAYSELNLTLGAGIYGSTFFMLTGFHGMHVTVGAIMLCVILGRCLKGHFTAERHFAFEAVAWYWHFVDVVWLGLFVFVYVL